MNTTEHTNTEHTNTEHTKNPRRVAAGSANGRLAKGKKSPEGRAASALNACKHFLAAQQFLLTPYEEPEAFELFSNMLIDSYSPQDPGELNIVLNLVHAFWRLRRVDSAEQAALELAHEAYQNRRTGITHKTDLRSGRVANWVCIRDSVSSDEFQNLRRYRTEIERSISRFTKLLTDYQKNRRPGPNTPYVPDSNPFEVSKEYREKKERQHLEHEAELEKSRAERMQAAQTKPQPTPQAENYETKVSSDVDFNRKC